jgi:hypothetical protein
MVVLVVAVMLCALASGASAALFQDNFNDEAWSRANWQFYITQYVSADNYSFVSDPENAANQVFRMVAGPASPAAGPEAGAMCNNWQSYWVDNMTIQVDINIQSGSGGALFWGMEEVPANDYYLIVAPSYDLIQISEEPVPPVGDGMVGNAPWDLDWNKWYTVKVVCTGTNFEVWFNERGQPLVKIFDVPQDQNHWGFQSHVRGQCGVYAENNGPPSPSTILVDNFVCDALETPPEEVFQDNFENSAWTLNNWVQFNSPVVTFESSADSQALRLSAPVGGDTVVLMAGNGTMYFSDAFTLRTAAYIDAGFKGGIGWAGAESGVTPGTFTDYFVSMKRVGDNVYVQLVEEENNIHYLMGSATVTGAPGVYWYNVEVVAGGTWPREEARFRVWVWPRTDPKPATPVIDVRQDALHLGYRLINLGAVGPWQDPGGSGLYDDFYLRATPVPAANTEPGTDVTVDAGEGVGLTFDNVDTGGATQVETSSTGPGPGPGNFQLAPEGGTGLYYDINTSCTFTGSITVCIPYDPAISDADAANLQLWHWDTLLVPPDWVQVLPTELHTDNHTVCGDVSHLSVFAIGAPPRFEGFLQPINMPPQAMSVVKAGSTIPVKFRLRAFFTQQIIDNATATIGLEYLGSDSAAAQVNELFIQALEDSGNAFRYDAADHQYIFNLKTRGLSPGIYRIHALIYGGLLDEWVDVRLR